MLSSVFTGILDSGKIMAKQDKKHNEHNNIVRAFIVLPLGVPKLFPADSFCLKYL